jgi:hypothetical protein
MAKRNSMGASVFKNAVTGRNFAGSRYYFTYPSTPIHGALVADPLVIMLENEFVECADWEIDGKFLYEPRYCRPYEAEMFLEAGSTEPDDQLDLFFTPPGFVPADHNGGIVQRVSFVITGIC